MLKKSHIALLVFTIAIMAKAGDLPKAQAFKLSRVRLLDGPFKRIQELHRTGLLGGLEPDKLLFPFRKNAGLPQPSGVTGSYGGWDDMFIRGHYCGHYLSGAARMYAATGDVSFREKADYIVTVLAECQGKLGNGYLSAFPATQFDRLETTPRASSVEYYTIHKIMAGLVDAADYCDNQQAMEIAARMSDYFAGRIAKLSSEQIELMLRTDYTGNPVNEFGGMAEALSDLYWLARKKGDPNANRHLKLAAVYNRDWFIDPLLQGQDRLNGLHGNTHIAQAAGLARYAFVSSDVRAGKAAGAFWNLVVQEHSFVNGGNTFHERLRAPGIEVTGSGDSLLSPLTAESCNTHNMLKLTRTLFECSPLSAYGDYYENALYNHILATIAPDHGKVMYYLSLRPGDYKVYIDEPYCCQGTGIENAARFGEAIYFYCDDNLWVNLFIASTLDWREQGIKLRLDTQYPENGQIQLSLNADKPRHARLNIRIPSWLEGRAEVKINGQTETADATPGAFLSLARTWKDGDVVTLELPLAVRIRPSMDDPTVLSLFYGPVLMAGKLGREGMPTTDMGSHMALNDTPPWAVPMFESETMNDLKLDIKQNANTPLLFRANMIDPADLKPMAVELAPLYLVHHQRYAVYWKAVSTEQ